MLKNKIIVRKIRNILILFMAMIVMVGAYRNIGRSRAEDVIEIGVLIQDNYGYLDNEEIILEAKEIGNDLYEMELPESVNTKKIEQIVKVTLEDEETSSDENIESKEDTQKEEELKEEDTISEEETTNKDVLVELENVVPQENAEEQKNNSLEIVENKIQFTKDQIENKKINIEVIYGIKLLEQDEDGKFIPTMLIEKSEEEREQLEITEETQVLYNKILKYEDKENAKLVEVRGFLPIDAKLQIEWVTQEQLKEIFGDKKKIDVAYDIKIIREVITQVPTDEAEPDAQPEEIIETVEINPEYFSEVCEVIIKDAKIQKDAKVYHVKDDNSYENVNVKENTEENVIFNAHTFSIYAVGTEIEDEGIMNQAISFTFDPLSETTYKKTITVNVATTDAVGKISDFAWTTSESVPSIYSAIETPDYTMEFAKGNETGIYYLHIKTELGNYYRGGPYYLDNTKPTISGYISPESGWSNADRRTLTIYASASDDDSGFSHYYWRYADGAMSNTVTGNQITYLNEQNKGIEVYAVDKAGNMSSNYLTATVQIDRTAPTAGTMTMKYGSSSGSAYTSGTWTNQDVYIAKNNGSDTLGVAKSGHSSTTYTVVKDGTTLYSNITEAKTLTDQGKYTITVTTKDVAGNTATNTDYVYIDKTAPTGILTASPTTYEGDLYYTNQSSFTAYVEASDTGGSGLNNTTPVIVNAWAGGDWASTHTSVNGTYNSSTGKYNSQFTFSNIVDTSTGVTTGRNGKHEGKYVLDSWAYDNASNSKVTSWIEMIYDKTAPTISVSTESCGWRNSALGTTITITDPTTNAYDGNVSGLSTSNSYQYYLSNSATALSGGSWTNYTSGTEINLNPGVSGTYYLFVKRVNDKAGNTSTTGGSATTVSSTTYQRFGPYQFDYDAPTATGITLSDIYTKTGKITATANGVTDNHSGVNRVAWYLLYNSNYVYANQDGDGQWNKNIDVSTLSEGRYMVAIVLRDNAGNQNDTTVAASPSYIGWVSFLYDKTAPTISVSTSSCSWRNSALSTTITLTDPTTNAADGQVSGLSTSNSYQYYLSKSPTTLEGGSWTNYTSGTAISLNPGTDGEYYLFVKRVSDNAGNISTTEGTSTTIDSTTYQRFGPYQFDYTKPAITYTHQSLDINTADKTYTMTFRGTDAHYASGVLTLDNLTVLMQNGQLDGSGNPIVYDLKEEPVTLAFRAEAYTGANGVTGYTYVLTISNLEQLEIKTGLTTADYSGVITVAVPANLLVDAAGNKNNQTTITTGVDIPGGLPTDEVPVDVVDPLWNKVSSSVNETNRTATLTVKGTDTYFSQSTLTTDKIGVFVNGTQLTATDGINISLSSVTPLNETRKQNGSNVTVQYGVQQTINVTGLPTDMEQLKIVIASGTLIDQTGNGNKTTEFILYNYLKWTGLETGAQSGFLGNTSIKRENIANVTFVSSIASANSTMWDVSARGDNSIIAWYETNANGTLRVYIGSNEQIYANKDSSNLFSYIGYGKDCATTEVITNLSLLKTSHVKNMKAMFAFTGYRAMTSLNLTSLQTGNVTNMREMFNGTGYKNMTTFTLPTTFDTSKVTDMSWMFANLGYTKLPTINLANINTNLVQDMSYMFANCGYTAMTSLTLGSNFSTENVTDMNHMFTSCGHTKLASLDLGNKFYTTNVTDMTNMFAYCGTTSMTSLDLGPAFTNISIINTGFLTETGKIGSCIIYAPESIYKNINNFKTSGSTPYIPIGYTHVEGTSLDTGYVVKDGSGNEFVWVEVPRTAEVYPTAGLSIKQFTDAEYRLIENDLHTYTSVYRNGASFTDTWSSETATGLTETEYNTLKEKMLKSIYKNGGFYVGRYETGSQSLRTETGNTTQTPVIKQNMYPYNYLTTAQAQELSESFKSTGYETSLMFGVQWDLMLKHIELSGEATVEQLKTDSSSLGNNWYNTSNITNTSAKYWRPYYTNDWYNAPFSKTDIPHDYALYTTGASDEFCKQNIYDFAGNVYENTLEFDNTNGITIERGGTFESSDSAFTRVTWQRSQGCWLPCSSI